MGLILPDWLAAETFYAQILFSSMAAGLLSSSLPAEDFSLSERPADERVFFPVDLALFVRFLASLIACR